jgi:iron complex outermembrane receptor protein
MPDTTKGQVSLNSFNTIENEIIPRKGTIMTTRFAKLAGTTALALALSVPAMAQESGDTVDEIFVTATKRAENIQDVPISITAYGAEFIEKSGVEDIHDVALYSPNFTISSSSQLTNFRIAIRGVGSVGNAGIEPSVGVFIDGVYYPKPGSVIGNLMDIQSFEVLRGPQGTLFGRNTPMGALNITTKNPTLSGFGGNYELGFGSENAVNIGASVNVPLGEKAAMRISGKYGDRDGYGTNLIDGTNIGARDNFNLRGKFLIEPSDNLSVKLTADYSKINSGGAIVEYLNSASSPVFLGTLAALASLDPRLTGIDPTQLLTADPFDQNVYQDQRDFLEDEQWGLSGDVSYDFGSGFVFRSITSYREWTADSFESAIRLPIQLFPRKNEFDSETFSQEFQLLSPTGGKFDYLVGAFYYSEKYHISQDFDLGAQFCLPVVLGVTGSLPIAQACAAGQQIDASDGEFNQDLSSLAGFAQGTYHFTDQFSLTLGGRYTSDDKTADFSNTVNNPFVIALSVRDNENWAGLDIGEFGDDTSQFTYFSNLSYHMNDDVMLFATVSTGFKSGGFNTDGVFPALTRRQRVFGPEDTTNYELGFKSDLMDGALRLNATAFLMDIEGFQDRAFDGISFLVRNVGSLRQKGVEIDTTWRPMEQLTFIGGLSYLDSEFTDYQNASPLPGGAPQDLTGTRAHFSPEWQYSLVADWTDQIEAFGGSEYFLRGEVQNVGTQNIGAGTNQNPQSIQEGYSLFNARLGLRSDHDSWEFSIWGKNLTDKGYCMTIFDQPFSAQLGGLDPVANTQPQRCVVGAPATYGATLKFRH